MIELNKIVKKYQGKTALSDIDLSLSEGEMTFLTGHSGAGKSTLLRLIAGIEEPSRGMITINGKNISKLHRSQKPHLRRRIGLIFQQPHLLSDRSVFDNVALPLQISGFIAREMASRVRAALDKVGLRDKERLNPQALSAGEQQRVGIARAIVNRPIILLADEPTGNLDPQLSLEIMKLFAEFNSVGVTALIASHNLALVQNFGYRIISLTNGMVASDTTTPC